MDKEQTRLEEQLAPLKNTDNAFVKVNEDGTPVMPDVLKEPKQEEDNKEPSTTIDKR